MPGRRKIGGCSIASNAQRSARDAASPRAIKSHGNTVNPATSATGCAQPVVRSSAQATVHAANRSPAPTSQALAAAFPAAVAADARATSHRKRSEEHTSELQSPCNLVCRLLLEKKKKKKIGEYV